MTTFDRALEARRGPKKLVRVRASKELAGFIDKHRIPRDLASELSRHSYKTWIDFRAATFDAVSSLPKTNRREARCMAQRLLVIGSGLNGDLVVADLRERSPTIGFVRHDDFWEDDEVPARDCFFPTPLGLGTFYLAAAKLADFPVDSYALEEISAKYWNGIETRALRAPVLPDPEPEEEDDADAPALHRAAFAHDIDQVRALIAAGSNVEERDAHGATALHHAVREPERGKRSVTRQVAVVRALLSAGADVEARDAEGNTPLLDAVMGMRDCDPTSAPGGPAMTRELLAAGADKNRSNKKRISPAKLAADVSFPLTKWLR